MLTLGRACADYLIKLFSCLRGLRACSGVTQTLAVLGNTMLWASVTLAMQSWERGGRGQEKVM